MLGENLGLVAAEQTDDPGSPFRSLSVKYIQNGSLGRRLNLEVRVFDSAVAFRYIIPQTTPLTEAQFQNELTDFDIARTPSRSGMPPAAFPWEDGGWLSIAEVPRVGFPRMSLHQQANGVLSAGLADGRGQSVVAYEGRMPLVSSWRVLMFGASEAEVLAWPLAGMLDDQPGTNERSALRQEPESSAKPVRVH